MSLDLADSLRDRVVVVTGAAGGIGSSVVTALADAGVAVVAVDLPGRTVARHELVVPLEADLTDVASHDALFQRAAEVGQVAGLVHAAAIIRRTAVDEVTEAEFDEQFAINVKATYFLDRAAWRAMRGQGGSIVNFVSQGWMTGGFAGSVVYAATKGAVTSMTRGLARSFAPDGVRVNAVSPGFVDTDLMQGITPEAMEGLVAQVPLGRIASPDDLVGATVFLLSDAANFVTGAVVNVSGGQLMY